MEKKIRVVVADDSALMRKKISEILNSDVNIEVVATAKNGKEALEAIHALRPDVVTLDLEMPLLDGFGALGYIMSEIPTPCVMISAFTKEGALETIRALELGAVDFIAKPGGVISTNMETVASEVIEKVKIASTIPISNLKLVIAEKKKDEKPAVKMPSVMEKLFVIASSTGGTQALASLLPKIRADIPAGIVCVQHMPEGFTKSLAERLSWQSKISVVEAENNMPIRPGQALIAKGGYHIEIEGNIKEPFVTLNTRPPIHGVRPSADPAMQSAAKVFGPRTVGIVLTGMGRDGTDGAGSIKAAGGKVIAEDRSSCVVYGMPKSVTEAGFADKVSHLGNIAEEMERLLK